MEISSELLKLRGRLGEAEKRAAQLEAAVDVDMIQVRDALDPFLEDLAALKVEEAAVSFERLKAEVRELRLVRRKIKEYKHALGDS